VISAVITRVTGTNVESTIPAAVAAAAAIALWDDVIGWRNRIESEWVSERVIRPSKGDESEYRLVSDDEIASLGQP